MPNRALSTQRNLLYIHRIEKSLTRIEQYLLQLETERGLTSSLLREAGEYRAEARAALQETEIVKNALEIERQQEIDYHGN